MRTYDFQRGLTTALAAGVAGFLLWIATQVGQETTKEFWTAMGIVAACGLVMSISQLVGGWTKWGWPRLSAGVFTLGFLPVLVCTGWILMATQPGNGWHEARLVSWSESLGIYGVVHDLGLYHGVLAFAFGLVLGFSFDTTGPRRADEVVVAETDAAGAEPIPTIVPMDRRDLDEPVTAEREEVVRTTERVPAGVSTPEAKQTRRVEIMEGGRRVVPPPPEEQLPADMD